MGRLLLQPARQRDFCDSRFGALERAGPSVLDSCDSFAAAKGRLYFTTVDGRAVCYAAP
jgi:hypothetical protein